MTPAGKAPKKRPKLTPSLPPLMWPSPPGGGGGGGSQRGNGGPAGPVDKTPSWFWDRMG